MFEAWGRFVYRRRRLVLLVAALVVAGAAVWGTGVFGALQSVCEEVCSPSGGCAGDVGKAMKAAMQGSQNTIDCNPPPDSCKSKCACTDLMNHQIHIVDTSACAGASPSAD